MSRIRDALTQAPLSRRRALQASAALALASGRAGAAEARELKVVYFDWVPRVHPAITRFESEFNTSVPVTSGLVPTPSFGFDRFFAEAKLKTSSWDTYIGATPFLDRGCYHR